jgi:hypothetical protein
VELGAVGVSISIFNLVSKMFNLPLLNVTTSFVAEDASEKIIVSDMPLEPTSPTTEGLLQMEGWLNIKRGANVVLLVIMRFEGDTCVSSFRLVVKCNVVVFSQFRRKRRSFKLCKRLLAIQRNHVFHLSHQL